MAHTMILRIACLFNREGLAAFDRESKPGTVDILVLPELFDGGYKRLATERRPMDDLAGLTEQLARLSERHGLTLIAGTVAMPGHNGKMLNASMIFSRGERIATVAKTHLFRPLADDQFFAPGEPAAPLALTCKGQTVRTGIIVCYDLRFPEIVRPWFKSGLDLLVVPARWPRVRDDAWQLLLRARAVENQCFTVGINARDEEGGGSYAFGPGGETAFELGPSVPDPLSWHAFPIDLNDIAAIKARLDTRLDARLL